MDARDHGKPSAAGTFKTLSGDLRRLLLQPDLHEGFTDLVIVCTGGEELPAMRGLLAARSPVLESMLTVKDMAEAGSGRIHLPEMESATMRICLEFFYTDTVQHTSWTPEHGALHLPMQVIAAAHFFLVDALQHVALSHLLAITSWISHDLHQTIEPGELSSWLSATPGLVEEIILVFNLGINLFNVCAPCANLHEILKRLGRILDMYLLLQVPEGTDYYKHISRAAMAHLLQNQVFPWGDVSMWEYGRFQHIVRWCGFQLLKDESMSELKEAVVQNTLHSMLPDWRYSEMSAGDAGDSLFVDIRRPVLDGTSQEVVGALAIPVATWLSTVCKLYFDTIPSAIQTNVIEPLLPDGVLSSADKQQASDWWEDLRWDTSNSPENDGKRLEGGHGNDSVIVFSCEADHFAGIAPCNLCRIFPGRTTLTWEIKILRSCKYAMIGFALARPRKHGEKFEEKKEWSWSLDSFGVLQRAGGQTRQCDDGFGVRGESVRVRLDMQARSCAFFVNGRDVNALITNLPVTGQVYPAIYMRKPGRVQVRLHHLQ